MISCKNVAKLLLNDELRSGNWWKRMEVRLHMAMCKFCSRLARQIAQMGDAAKRLGAEGEVDSSFEDRLIRWISRR